MKSNENILLEKPPLFFENYLAKETIIVNQGGSSSGKTYTLIDMFFVIAMSEENSVITVVGQDIPNLKSGAYRDAKNIYYSSDVYQQWFGRPNETDRIFKCVLTGSIIEFKSYSDEQDAKSGKRQYLFVNEANGIPYSVYWQLALRTYKKIYIDYNPTSRFWVHEELIGKPGVKLIISDHRHNPYLSKGDHERIESISDPELFKVYARGLTGKLQGLIYTNWVLCDEMPDTYKKRFIGLDFGFSNDPTAIIDVRLSSGELWVDELCYRTGLINVQPKNGKAKRSIEDELKDNGIYKNVGIVADCQESKSIAELSNVGFIVEPSKKGRDSINSGIDILQRYKINITRRSKGIRREVLSYKWKEDKNGKPLNEPIGEFNHALDAIRYVAGNKFGVDRTYKRPRARNIKLS